jgi:shikimate kinase
MKTSIALVGFMGTGKTAVGKALAERLGKTFIELDPLIEQKAGKTIPEIFEEDGEIAFRELEIEVSKEAASRENVVIACGGGVVLNKINIDRMRKEAVIVYLTATSGAILERILNDDEERPLLTVADPARAVNELMEFRRPFYERAAEITIDTSQMDVESIATEIINRLKVDEGFRL